MIFSHMCSETEHVQNGQDEGEEGTGPLSPRKLPVPCLRRVYMRGLGGRKKNRILVEFMVEGCPRNIQNPCCFPYVVIISLEKIGYVLFF